MRLESSPALLLDPSVPATTVLRPCLTIRSGTDVRIARRHVLRYGAEEAVVVDHEHRPLGLVYAGVLLDGVSPDGCMAAGDAFPTSSDDVVDDLMAVAFVAVSERASVQRVCEAMSRRRAAVAVIVSQDDRLAGIVTAEDVVAWVGGRFVSDSWITGAPTDVDG